MSPQEILMARQMAYWAARCLSDMKGLIGNERDLFIVNYVDAEVARLQSEEGEDPVTACIDSMELQMMGILP